MELKPPIPTAREEPAQCFLLELPAELRNRIYEYALHDQDVTVTAQGYGRSSLVSTCHQIRRETLQIFYYENTFTFIALACNSDVLLRFHKHLKAIKMRPRKVNTKIFQTFDQPNWTNLRKWLSRKHSHRHFPGLAKPSDALERFKTPSVERILIGSMFVYAKQMRGRPWSEVEKFLNEQRIILEQVNSAWSQT